MLRSARSTRIAQTFTLPTVAIIAAACGGEVKNVKEVVGDSANPVATITVCRTIRSRRSSFRARSVGSRRSAVSAL